MTDVKQMAVSELLAEKLAVPVSEQPFDLPRNWNWVKMGRLFTFIGGGTPPKSEPSFWEGGIPWASVKDIKDKYLFETMDSISEAGLENSSATLAEPNDVILVTRMSPGKSVITKIRTAINQDLKIVRSNLDIHPVLIWAFFKSNIKKFESVSTGTTVKGLKIEDLNNIPFPLPPLPEQKRIVDRIEPLLGKVEEANQLIAGIPTLLKQIRYSIVSESCSGRLTAEWRKRHTDIEKAADLVERVREERKRIYEESCEKAKAEGKRSQRAYKESVEAIDTTKLPDIPDTWSWERLVNISDIQGGVSKGRKFKGEETIRLPYLRVANVQDGYLDLAEIFEIEVLPEEQEKYLLLYGDLLFTEGGDRDKLGRGTVWKDEIENCIHQNHIFRARLCDSNLVPEYFSLATKSEYAKSFFFENANQTINLASISITTLGKVPVAIPPIAEQHEIVRRVSALFEYLDQVEYHYRQIQSRIDTITQSILSKAFRGELGTNDPSEESALGLLQQVLAERLNEAPKKRKAAAKTK